MRARGALPKQKQARKARNGKSPAAAAAGSRPGAISFSERIGANASLPVETMYGAVVSDRVACPKPIAFDFDVRIDDRKVEALPEVYQPHSVRGKLLKKMKKKSAGKRTEAGMKMSIEGRGV